MATKEHRTRNSKEFFEVTLPEAVVGVVHAAEVQRFDAIIVDEAQDFLELWWVALESLFAPTGRNLFRIFFDSNQRVYDSAVEIIRNLKPVSHHLGWNLRNTRGVHYAVYRYYTGREVLCNGP